VGRHLVDCCGGEWDVSLRLRPVSGLRGVQGQQRQAAIHCDAFHSATELPAAPPHALATQQDLPVSPYIHTLKHALLVLLLLLLLLLKLLLPLATACLPPSGRSCLAACR
jgi:hypothetical protein